MFVLCVSGEGIGPNSVVAWWYVLGVRCKVSVTFFVGEVFGKIEIDGVLNPLTCLLRITVHIVHRHGLGSRHSLHMFNGNCHL